MTAVNHICEVFNSPYYKRLSQYIGSHVGNPYFNRKAYSLNPYDYSRPFGFPVKEIWPEAVGYSLGTYDSTKDYT